MSDDLDSAPLADTLVLDERVPLSCETLPELPPADQLADWDRRNADILQVLLALDEGSRLPEEGGEPVAQEIVRLERKLDLVLDLLARMMSERQSTPMPMAVHLSERGLEWSAVEPAPIGAVLCLELHLESRYPVPLRVCARVVDSSTDAARGGPRCTVGFLGVSESTRELLAKLIFRAHRRSIGRRRSGRS